MFNEESFELSNSKVNSLFNIEEVKEEHIVEI